MGTVVGDRRGPERLWRALPHGRTLPTEVWAQRHRGILVLLWLHVPALFGMALARSEGIAHALFEAGVVAAIAAMATVSQHHVGVSTVMTSVGLMTCSAELVHLSDGLIEMHFHFFVMVGVVTLYQDWRPFLVAIGYVVVHHGAMGALAPASVYNHPAAIASPWRWAAVHGSFILAMSATGIVTWKLNELLLAKVTHRQELLEEAQELAKLGSWEYRADDGGGTWSPEMYRLLGVDQSFPTNGDAVAELVHPDDRQAWQDDMARAATPGGLHALDFRVVRPDGDIRWLHGRGAVTVWDGTEIAVMSGTVQDITERKVAEEALRASNAARRDALSLLEATLDSTADGILVVGRTGQITGYNRRFAEMWRLPEDLLRAGDHRAALSRVVDQLDDPDGFAAKVTELYAQLEAESHDIVHFRDGRVFERYSMPQRVEGEVVGRVWSFRDVTDRARLQDELEHQAFHDSLTGLANQALFRDRVDHAITRLRAPTDSEVAVLFVDLDNFKNVNDSLGHAAGDELLIAVTARLVSQLRPADTAARMGGDEFAILLEDLPGLDEAEEVANRLLDALHRPFCIADKDVFTTASIGIAGHRLGGTGDQLLRDADLAMYTAKRFGKDRVERFAPEMHEAAMERIELEADLRRACERDELRLEYQPIVSLDTGELLSVEALVRWEHPQRGLLPPGAFIPFAEESGLIEEIGLWVLEQACSQTRRWQELRPDRRPVGVSVNLSPRQLRNDELVETVSAILTSTGLAPAQLTLEITETAMMHDTELALARLLELKALGVRLAIDDFGTGYSSLNYLQRFPIDVIKIDRAFVERIEHGVEESSLARAIVRLAQTLQLAAVAEGVENAAQTDWLREIGCTSAQGFHLSRPVDADQITALLAEAAPFPVAAPRLSGV